MSGDPSSESNNQQRLTEKKKAENALVELFGNFSLTEGKAVAPMRKAPGKIGHRNLIDTNIYKVTTDDRYVFRYDVNVIGQSRRGTEVDLTKRSDSSAVIADRINICRKVFRCVFQTHSEFFGTNEHAVYYDLQSILYTLKPLSIIGNAPMQLLVENTEKVQLPGNLAQVTMEIRNVREKAQRIQLNDLNALINEETLTRDRSVLNFIELAVSQYPMFNEAEFLTLKGSMEFFLKGKDYGLPDKRLDQNGTKYLGSGVQKSATLIEGVKDENSDPKQRQIGLTLEAKYRPFHSMIPLTNLIQFNINRLYDGFIRGELNEHQLAELTRIFKKMQFLVFYPDNRQRKIQLRTFDRTTANDHIIPNLNITVAQYFAETYQQRLKHPHAHLVCVKQGNHLNYYPPEYLGIADNQVVTAQQMDATAKAAMIRACVVRPDEMKENNDSAAKAIRLHKSPFTQGAEIKFSEETLNTVSRIFPSPSVGYAKGESAKFIEGQAAWRMKRFYKPVQCEKFAVYVIKDNKNSFSQRELQKFIEMLSRNNTGVQFLNCIDKGFYSSMQVEECIEYCKNKGAKICFFITPENIKSCHSVMKSCEHKYNIVTQDLQDKTARKICNGATATLENFIAKTNMKLGGLNNVVTHANSEIQQELETTMFVGIATNQPGSKTIVDRVKSGVDENPGVLGYSANFGANYNEYIGGFHYTQAYRPEFYGELREIFKKCVECFKITRNFSPMKIIFYYNGLTEGQFESVYKYAIPLIKDGIKEANGGIDIPLTVLAEQAKNHTRLFPLKFPATGENHKFNVPHGTVVDTTIVHPVFSEFYLMPHSSLKGTARVPQYIIPYDENDYSMDILEGVTYTLSYEHQICGRATKLPTPIVVSETYANRGRDVFNALYFNSRDELPRQNDGTLDFRAISEKVDYMQTDLWNIRVTA